MTAVCAGGSTATAKPAFGSATYISAAALGAKFANTASWASVFIAGYIGAMSFDLQTFCPNGPPAIPTLTADDFKALLVPQLNLLAFNDARKRLQDWVGGMVWYDLCDCPGGLAGALPTPQAQPVDMPTYNPPQFPFPNPIPCRSATTAANAITGVQDFSRTAITLTGVPGSYFQWKMVNGILSGGGVSITFKMTQQANIPAPNLKEDTVVVAPGATATRTIPYFSPLNTLVTMSSKANGGAGVSTDQHIVDLYCGSDSPVVPQSPCCPPDPSLDQRINELLVTVTLIQRALVPFAYIAGSVHSGLTGSGSFAIQGILGAKVSLTTVPSQLGRSGLLPEELFDAGFVTFSTPDGYPHSVRVEHNPQLVLPPRASVYTAFSYDLHPGVVATVTELLREP